MSNRIDEPFYVGYNIARYELGLLPDGDPGDGALTYWGVDDVTEAVRVALAFGAVEHTAVSEVGGGIVTATVLTPDRGARADLQPHFAEQ